MPKAKYDLNDNGKIDPDERDIMLEDRRRMMEDADAKRDAQLRMTWFALSGMVLYPFAIVLASWMGLEQASTLLKQLRTNATHGSDYRERALATEALRRLVAPRGQNALATAQRRVMQSLLEAEWAPPQEDPRQNGQIAGLKRAQEVTRAA